MRAITQIKHNQQLNLKELCSFKIRNLSKRRKYRILLKKIAKDWAIPVKHFKSIISN